MQTFLPYSDFHKTAKVLDYRRLGKQRVEAMQIINVIDKINLGARCAWMGHPAVLMWVGYEQALKLYHNIMIVEWVRRGYNNNMKLMDIPDNIEYPHWLGDERLHRSHRSALLYKDFRYYSQFNWAEKPELNYFWAEGKKNGQKN